jgi:hypothetical protein
MSVELRNTCIYINLVAKSDKRKITKRHVSRWNDTIKMVFMKYGVEQTRLVEVRGNRSSVHPLLRIVLNH